MRALNATHDPALRSWVGSAQAPQADFPLQNLPFAVFRRARHDEAFRGGVAIGDQVLDLAGLARLPGWPDPVREALAAAAQPALNTLMGLPGARRSALRAALSGALREGSALESSLRPHLIPQDAVEFTVPAVIGDFTDFYASIHHATAVGRMFRPEQPLLPNYRWVPIAYHGRASSVRVSGVDFARPRGQILPRGASVPVLAPSQRLDFEMEVGVYVGPGNAAGTTVPLEAAEEHVFGLCLLNDWSARDIQAWEYQPLGPFLAKSFATTVSPWVVTLEALAPYRAPLARPPGDAPPLAYLDGAANREGGAIDLTLEAWLETAAQGAAAVAPVRLTRSSFAHAWWSIAQMLTHHTVNGCDLRPGDLLGSGTQSGPQPQEAGSLLELTAGGRQPLTLPGGQTRSFLEDGDRVILTGWCEREGYARIGFGSAAATVLPAPPA